VRNFVGFTAAGASVGLVAWLYQQGGLVTMLHAFAGLCLLVIAAAIILPTEIRVPAVGANRPPCMVSLLSRRPYRGVLRLLLQSTEHGIESNTCRNRDKDR
jgi:hypothetical protein